MDFKEKLQQAKAGGMEQKEDIFLAYRPMLLKYAMVEKGLMKIYIRSFQKPC